MFVRWLHTTWKYFWRIFFALLFTVVMISITVIGLLQLDTTQDYLADRLEQTFENTYRANLSVGDVDGFLPFQLNLRDISVVRADSAASDTIATVEQLSSQIDVWSLLQNRISINGFSLNQPEVWLRSGKAGEVRFLERRKPISRDTTRLQKEPWLSTIEIIAPNVEISEGAFYLESTTQKTQIANLPQSFSITNVNADLFVDWSERQRYLDFESFTAETGNLKMDKIEFSGQVFSDRRFLEFNSFYITVGDSRFTLNGQIDGLNLLQPNFMNQLLASHLDLDINSGGFYLHDLGDFLANMPKVQKSLTMDVRMEGTADSLWVDRAVVSMGESVVNVNGLLKNLRDPQNMAYEFRLDRVNFKKTDLAQVFDSLAKPQYRALENLTMTGKANGSTDSLAVDLSLDSPRGKLTLQGESRLKEPYEYRGTMNGTGVDISTLVPTVFDTTSLNFSARLEGLGVTLEKAASELNVIFTNSKVDEINFDALELKSSLINGLWSQEYTYRNSDERITGSGWVDFSRDDPPVSMQGNAENVNLARVLGGSGFVSSQLNFDYNVELRGLTPNRIQGRANIDVKPSILGGDSVRTHQLYMDFNSPDQQTRSFRLTSSLFDLNVTGQIAPGDIIEQTRFWRAYLTNRFKAEILMNSPVDSQATSVPTPNSNVVLDGDFKAKDLGLVKKYFPNFPTIVTDSQINFNVNTDGTRLLISGKMKADTLRYNKLNFNNSSTELTASFRSDRSFSEFSSVDFQANVEALEMETADLDSMGVDFSVKRDSVHFAQYIGAISDNASHKMKVSSSISDSAIHVSVGDFFLGNSEYSWINDGTPSFAYQRNGSIDFNDFNFQNRDENFSLQGTLSKNRSDALTYTLQDINLSRISDLIKGKVNFAGVLNGQFTTRSLTNQPTIQGNLDVDQFALNNRLIGDVGFDSRYNPNEDRFDTQIDIVTDSTKYKDYIESNDGVGQNIRLDGYFVTPDPNVKQDSVFYFDADFRQIDMWVIPLIVDNVFAEMEGQASGKGYVTGNLEDFDFHADFQTKNVFAKPQFLNTNYFLSGHVVFDRQDGVVLDSLDILDTKGGTGELWGTIDLNDFDPLTYIDLTMDMDELQFLNNKFDPDVPFYGSVSGTGVVRLTGSNRDLYMRTQDPVEVTSSSEISIPLLEETELQQTGKFIRFVDSFENLDKKTTSVTDADSPEQVSDEEELEEAIESMTFTERFDLDLQFESSDNVTVNLIFDPVTGEVLTAGGTGQVRITMQDQDVQMFGRYNINDGNYQFVTGEIISRNLELEPGGTIVWEGPPDNARLDISAIYHARPDIRTLVSDDGVNEQDQAGGQRVPVDLIVEINGTINSVENNYYFRLPTSLDLSSNSTLQYTINQINRDEQQKLFQATSILLTGQFIPTQETGSATASLSQSLTRGSTVLNPLLSNQVISPLLSNQINALLNSDVSRLDIDFNLNAYNEVDLGIALRLYNDRLVLRREGQITGGGAQSSLGDRIGDLNATYRIRRGLSLTAFHRQDQVLNSLGATSSRTGDVTPSVDGIGLEARLQFNTWKELLDQVDRTFARIFGGKKKDETNDDDRLADQEAREEQK